MVYTKSQKTLENRDRKVRRFSILDHALGALVDLQVRDGSKRHSLRAFRNQVKKNTEAQNDPLRKGWKRWVDLACEKLINLGIIDRQAPPGQVVLTTEGRKKLNEASAALELEPEHKHAPECKEPMHIRNFLCESQSISHKEWDRRASGRPQFQIDLEYLMENAGNEKKLMRLRKAELVKGLTTLSTYLSKIVELEEANKGLKSELETRDDIHLDLLDEIKELKERFEGLPKDGRDSDMTFSTSEDADSIMENSMFIDPPSFSDVVMDSAMDNLHTEIPQTPTSPSFMSCETQDTRECPSPAPTEIDDQPPSSLMRTISSASSILRGSALRATGSIISQISKRPTPAPSEIGSPPGSPTFSTDGDGEEDAATINQSFSARNGDETDVRDSNQLDENNTSFDPDTTCVNDDSRTIFPSTSFQQGKGKEITKELAIHQVLSPEPSPLRLPRQMQACLAMVNETNGFETLPRLGEGIYLEKLLANKAPICRHVEEINSLNELLSQKDIQLKELGEEHDKKLRDMEKKAKDAEENMMEAYKNLREHLEEQLLRQEEEERKRRLEEEAKAKERAAHLRKLDLVKLKMQPLGTGSATS